MYLDQYVQVLDPDIPTLNYSSALVPLQAGQGWKDGRAAGPATVLHPHLALAERITTWPQGHLRLRDRRAPARKDPSINADQSFSS